MVQIALLPCAAHADMADPPPLSQFKSAPKIAVVVCESFDAQHRTTLRVEHWLRGKGGARIVLARPFLEEGQPYIDQRSVLGVKGRYLLCMDERDQPFYGNSAIPLPYVGAPGEAEWPALSKAPKKLGVFLKKIIADALTWQSKPVSGLQMRFTTPKPALTANGPLALTLELRNLTSKRISLPKAVLELTAYLKKANRYAKLVSDQAQANEPARVELRDLAIEPGKLLALRLGTADLGGGLKTPSPGPFSLFCTLRGGIASGGKSAAKKHGGPKAAAISWAGPLSIVAELSPRAD